MATKSKSKPKRKATTRAKDAVSRIIANHGNIGKSMIEAGYSEAYAKNPRDFLSTQSIKEDVDEVLSILKKGRTRAFREAMSPKKLKKASAYTAALTGDILAKNERLFEGKATEVINHQFEHLADDALQSHIARLEDSIRRSTGGKTATNKQ